MTFNTELERALHEAYMALDKAISESKTDEYTELYRGMQAVIDHRRDGILEEP